MRPRSSLLILLATVALVAAACSGSTVVGSADRAATSGASDDTNTSDDASVNSGDSEDDDEFVAADVPDLAGYGLGGPEQLASLTEDCEAGSDQACDILFSVSDGDSIEETVALSCAGRGDANTDFCTEGINADGNNLFFDISSPALDEIASECEDGDMTACDFLYFRSPVGSTFEELGNTCGGRTAVALPDCRTFFEE